MRRTTARWLVVGALAGFGWLVGAQVAAAQEPTPTPCPESQAQSQTCLQNNADSTTSESGTAEGSNSANGDVGAQDHTDVHQDGDNSAEVNQSAEARSGDSVAGSQVVGVVADGDTTVTATNSSERSEATSGNATATNSIDEIIVGPVSNDGSVEQTGDNDLTLSQTAIAETGDAVAGGQIIGIVTSGGSASVDSTNESDRAESTSGDADASNETEDILVGPLTGSVPFTTSTGASSTSAGLPSSGVAVLPAGSSGGGVGAQDHVPVHQDGDNTAEVTQTAVAGSGDAIAGGQVIGLVGSELGSIEVVSRQSSDSPTAVTGNATAANTMPIDTFVGPVLTGVGGIEQDGDNELTLTQTANAQTGDAVAGAQVVGAVGSGDASIVLDNTSEDAEATSGDATAGNLAAALVGPIAADGDIFQEGDNTLDLDQSGSSASGDAVAGGQVVGVVTAAGGDVSIDATNTSDGDEAVSGDALALDLGLGPFSNIAIALTGPIETGGGTIFQDGDNDAVLSQTANTASGDAVAGGQVIGTVAAGSVDIVAENTSDGSSADSGTALGANVGVSITGPLEQGGGDIDQFGDNTSDLTQSLDTASGDAVAGGQVIGVVTSAGGDASVDATNASDGDEAVSGDAIGLQVVQGITGPVVSGGGTIFQDGDNDLAIGQSADTASGDAVAGGQVIGIVAAGSASVVADNTSEDGEATSGTAVGGNVAIGVAAPLMSGTGTITQFGDNDATIDQLADTASGDAVAGGQVIGVVASAGGSASVDATNTSEDAEATSGDAIGASLLLLGETNVAIGLAGPFVSGGGTIFQDGDNTLVIGQSADTASGDAVAGGQVIGLVSAGSVSVVASNTSEDAEATSGTAVGGNVAFGAFATLVGAGPVVSGDGTITQLGDNDLTMAQSADTASGDAVAGGQVIGAVASGGDATIEATNSSDRDEAVSGDAAGVNLAVALAGPVVTGTGTITQGSDNDATIDQSVNAASGDAVAGGQVIGVVASGGSTSVVASNTSERSDATSGDVVLAANVAQGLSGPIASGTGTITQDGDNTLDIGQSADAASGDAVAGGQVIGVVNSGGDVAVDATNTSERDDAVTGDVLAANLGVGIAGPIASDGSTILQTGDNDATIDQSIGAASGDAVAGGQVIGIVSSGGTTSVVASNTSERSDAETGDAIGVNLVLAGLAGPIAGTDATLTQDGDNTLDISQSADLSSGDAVAGGQVVGVVNSGGDVAIDATNTSERADASTGDATGIDLGLGLPLTNTVGAAIAGPIAGSGSTIMQTGDNDLSIDQSADASSGDAVAGGSVIGAVASGGSLEIVASNTSERDEADTGNATAGNLTVAALAGPVAGSTATITQDGDNDLAVGQSASADSGDAVAGGQVIGAVVSGGDVTVNATNTSERSDSSSGDADATNLIGAILVGPVAGSGSTIFQTGDNDFSVDQTQSVGSGDAVSGSQVIGVVASSGDVDVTQDNTSERDDSTTGTATGTNEIVLVIIGPFVP